MDQLVRAVTGAAENTSAAPSKPPSALRAALSSALVNEVKNVATLGKRVPVLAVKVVGALWDAPAPQLGDEVYVSVHGQLRDGRVVQSASTRPSPRSSSTIWNEELLLPLPADASQLELRVSVSLSFSPIVDLVPQTMCTVADGETVAAGDYGKCSLDGLTIPVAPTYGMPLFYIVNVTTPTATLLVELTYPEFTDALTAPPPVRLLANGVGGGCPSFVQHQGADWWPRKEAGPYGLDNIQLPDMWSQRLTQV